MPFVVSETEWSIEGGSRFNKPTAVDVVLVLDSDSISEAFLKKWRKRDVLVYTLEEGLVVRAVRSTLILEPLKAYTPAE